jgi:hypothetical protein
MRRRLTPAFGLTVVLFSTAACFRSSDPRDPATTPRDPSIRRPVGPNGQRGSVIAKKMVAAKNPPVTFIAGDATHCDTDEKKFKDTKVGDVVNCVWQY